MTDELAIPAVLEGRRDVTPSVLESTTGLEGNLINLGFQMDLSFIFHLSLTFFPWPPVLFQSPSYLQRNGVFQAALVTL